VAPLFLSHYQYLKGGAVPLSLIPLLVTYSQAGQFLIQGEESNIAYQLINQKYYFSERITVG
jgi:hypothetical protein